MSLRWIQLTFTYLLVTACVGVLMRSMAIFPIPVIEYEYILHAHSHLALLGWGYMAIFLLFLFVFLDKTEQLKKQIKILFVLTQFTVIGMFISFFIQGYGLYSISFSTLQVILSYWFIVLFWRQLRHKAVAMKEHPVSYFYVKASLICLALSSMGPWSLAILSANQMKESPLYEVAIYFYLHFQYNGWFTFALLAILLRILEQKGVVIPRKLLKHQFAIYAGSILPSFLLSVLWLDLPIIWHLIASIAVSAQWMSIILFINYLYQIRNLMREVFQGYARKLLYIAVIVLLVKVTLELVGAIVPGLTALIYSSRSIVIGYLHLTLLGFVSMLCIALFVHQGWLNVTSKSSRIGYMLFLIFLGVNEFILFLQGFYDWTGGQSEAVYIFGPIWLWIASIGMALGIGLIWPRNSNYKPRVMNSEAT